MALLSDFLSSKNGGEFVDEDWNGIVLVSLEKVYHWFAVGCFGSNFQPKSLSRN